jgi:hypothetical protein
MEYILKIKLLFFLAVIILLLLLYIYACNVIIIKKTDSKFNNIIKNKMSLLNGDVQEYPKEYLELFCFVIEKKASINKKDYDAFLKALSKKAKYRLDKDLNDYNEVMKNSTSMNNGDLYDIYNNMYVYKDIFGNAYVFKEGDINKIYFYSIWKRIGNDYCIQQIVLHNNKIEYCKESNIILLKDCKLAERYYHCNCLSF